VPENLHCTTEPPQCICDIIELSVDEVSFEVQLSTSSVSYVAAVNAGRAIASIPELQAGSYKVQVRAHRRGENQGNPAAWSAMSASVKWTVPESSGRPAKAPGHWLEVFRLTDGAGPPDFLDQHNAADLVGLANYIYAGWGQAITRYCVEVLPLHLTEAAVSYADYASCNSGQCTCMNLIDRVVARQPADEIRGSCPTRSDRSFLNMSCYCSNDSSSLSQLYVGRLGVVFPICLPAHLSGKVTLPPGYPPSADEGSPLGHWFSFPTSGHCKQGMRPGATCKWQPEQLSHTVIINTTFASAPNTSTCMPTKELLRVVEHTTSAFSQLNLLPCGVRLQSSSENIVV